MLHYLKECLWKWKPFWFWTNQVVLTISKHPLQKLTGVGPQLAAKLSGIGIHEPVDLLFHLPYRYQDRTRVTPIGDLVGGNDSVIIGRIDDAQIRFGRRRMLLVSVSDDTGHMVLRFFHFSQSQQRGLKPGSWIQCFGEARGSNHALEMVHPEYRLFRTEPPHPNEKSLTPVYPTTEGVGPLLMRKLVDQALTHYLDDLVELLPFALLKQFELMSLRDAIVTAHQPPPDSDTHALMEGHHPAQQRLIIEELLAHHLALKHLRQRRQFDLAPVFSHQSPSWLTLLDLLGFDLTSAQRRVVHEILDDLAKPTPCLRLVQGDVGSGKTVVAAAAALRAIDNGFQVALMAPTELLAEQHRKTFSEWFDQLDIPIQWLTGKLSASLRREALSDISTGAAKMVIGTHALFQNDVDFHQLGLVIVDEQHRFGVDQRMALRNKGELQSRERPHQLIMSATPIPRSLAMIFYADLDVSSIDELPPGRKLVNTIVLPNTRRDEVAMRIQHICHQGQQVYWVCPLIEESDKLQAQAATDACAQLKAMLPALNIQLIHGRMKGREKTSIMNAFSQGEVDVLVATTVIEVGVDVPNANLMIIENAERLGLAQLHQLRGRVGRGADQASCVLMYQPPLGRTAKERLAIMRETNDGFKIAQKDLEHRGPGELLGTRQTGLQSMQIADISRDKYLFPLVERLAQHLVDQDTDAPTAIINRWIKHKGQYANV